MEKTAVLRFGCDLGVVLENNLLLTLLENILFGALLGNILLGAVLLQGFSAFWGRSSRSSKIAYLQECSHITVN